MYERIGRLVELGALVQATADFFLRERMAAGMLALAEAGLVHVLSSDAHSSHGGRPAKLAAAFERLATVEPAASHIDVDARHRPAGDRRGRRPGGSLRPGVVTSPLWPR